MKLDDPTTVYLFPHLSFSCCWNHHNDTIGSLLLNECLFPSSTTHWRRRWQQNTCWMTSGQTWSRWCWTSWDQSMSGSFHTGFLGEMGWLCHIGVRQNPGYGIPQCQNPVLGYSWQRCRCGQMCVNKPFKSRKSVQNYTVSIEMFSLATW